LREGHQHVTDGANLFVCCSELQFVAVCCRVLPCVAVCVAVCCRMLHRIATSCRVLMCITVCCSVLQCVAVRGSVVQCVAVCCRRDNNALPMISISCVSSSVAVCYSVLRYVPVCCRRDKNTLQTVSIAFILHYNTHFISLQHKNHCNTYFTLKSKTVNLRLVYLYVWSTTLFFFLIYMVYCHGLVQCSVLQCVAVCCSVLCVVKWYSVCSNVVLRDTRLRVESPL